jgi:hypothetical protein
MALKSWYLSVMDSVTHKPVSQDLNRRLFFNAPDLNKYVKEKELLEKYPKPQYYFVKENY